MSKDLPPSEFSRTAARVASRRWQESRRRITLFIPIEMCEGVDLKKIRAIAYAAIFKALADDSGGHPPDAS